VLFNKMSANNTLFYTIMIFSVIVIIIEFISVVRFTITASSGESKCYYQFRQVNCYGNKKGVRL
jgi:hypothetical protein